MSRIEYSFISVIYDCEKAKAILPFLHLLSRWGVYSDFSGDGRFWNSSTGEEYYCFYMNTKKGNT